MGSPHVFIRSILIMRNGRPYFRPPGFTGGPGYVMWYLEPMAALQPYLSIDRYKTLITDAAGFRVNDSGAFADPQNVSFAVNGCNILIIWYPDNVGIFYFSFLSFNYS